MIFLDNCGSPNIPWKLWTIFFKLRHGASIISNVGLSVGLCVVIFWAVCVWKLSIFATRQGEIVVTQINDLRAMKRILYDMGPLTLVRWPLYRALKVWQTLRTRIQAEKGLPNNKCVLKWSIAKIQCLRPCLSFFFFLVENLRKFEAQKSWE